MDFLVIRQSVQHRSRRPMEAEDLLSVQIFNLHTRCLNAIAVADKFNTALREYPISKTII